MPCTEVKAGRQKGDGMEETREYYADIIVDISHEKLDRPFQYRIPQSLKGKLETGA